MQADNRGRHQLRHRRQLSVSRLDGVQSLSAKRQPLLLLLVPLEDTGIQVPAVIIKAHSAVSDQLADIIRGLLLQVRETHHDVCYLDPGVVDIVLHFDVALPEPQQAHESVAQHGVAQVTDMRGFVGIDAGVLHDDLRPAAGSSIRRDRSRGCRSAQGKKRGRQCGAVEVKVQKPRARNFHPLHAVQRQKLRDDLLGDFARCLPELPGQLKAGGYGKVAHLDRGRESQDGLVHFVPEYALHNLHEPTPHALLDFQVH